MNPDDTIPKTGTRAGNPASRLLLLILLVGAGIALADGLSRPFIPDDDPTGDALQYEPAIAAYAFAAVMLPLCLLYASRVRTSWAEGLLLWFILCTTAYLKDFAYIRPLPIPAFVTDLCLVVLLVDLLFYRGLRWLRPRNAWLKILCVFLLAGISAAVRGALGGQEMLLVARDFAMVFYVLFIFVGAHVVRTWDSVQRLCQFFGMGTAFSVVVAVAWFLAQPGQRRYLAFGVYVLVAFVGSLVLVANRQLRGFCGLGFLGVFALGIIVANARTIYVSLVVLLAAAMVLARQLRFNAAPRLRRVAGALVISSLLFLAAAQTETGRGLVERTSEELASGTVQYLDDPNARFRFAAWLEALRRFEESPLMGEGFGIPFTFEFSAADARPHNMYMTVLYKAGLLGLLPLLLTISLFHWRCWKTVQRLRFWPASSWLHCLLLGHLAMCLFGLLNLLLESPFLSSVFWLMIGIGLRLIVLLSRVPLTEFKVGSAT